MDSTINSHSDIEVIKQAALKALDENPDLSIHGWHGDPTRSENDPARYVADEKWAYMQRPRPSDIASIDYERVRTAMRYIETNCKHRKTFNSRRGSYGLKHDAERWGRESGMSPYVANGEFILAAILTGFEYKREKRAHPNCIFNMS